MVVINYKNSREMVIEFQDEHKSKVKCQKVTFEKGSISNPFHPTIYGVGYQGDLPKLNISLRCFHPYNVWRLMLRRCYDTESKLYETYRDCFVCDEWLCFSNFLKWHNENYYEIDGVRMQLDKDILSNENKIYSPNTCVYVPADINEMFKIQRKERDCPQGVFYHKKDKVFVCYSYKFKKTVGNYKTAKEAHLNYLKDKQEKFLERAEFYKNDVPDKLHQALKDYKVVAQMSIHNYINLTNGIEAIPEIDGNYKFIRIQSTLCEAKNWDRLIQDLDYDFLMNLALGHKCVVYDFGARKPVPRAVYQGVEFVKYVLNRRWLNQEYITNVNRSKNKERKNNCNDYFNRCYQQLEDRTKKKLDYFLPYVITEEINLECVANCTQHDNDKEFYREILRRVG